jgi:hypothetical protein
MKPVRIQRKRTAGYPNRVRAALRAPQEAGNHQILQSLLYSSIICNQNGWLSRIAVDLGVAPDTVRRILHGLPNGRYSDLLRYTTGDTNTQIYRSLGTRATNSANRPK